MEEHFKMESKWIIDGDMVIKNGYCIYPSFDGFRGQNTADKDARIVDERKIAKFNKKDGFATIEDCMEYADKYFNL